MNKKIVIVMFVVSILLLTIGVGFVVSDHLAKKEPKEGSEKTKQLTEVMKELLIWGQEIYDSGKYKSYQKDFGYFISVKEIGEDFQYDISEFVKNNCDIENTGITFNESDDASENYFVSLSGCQ